MEPLRKRAFTLIEAVVAAALLVILGTVIWQLLSFGIRAHGKGEAHRLAQSNARQILDLLTSELRSAVVLPVATPTLKSAVLWPDPWGTQGGVAFDPATFYPRVEQNEGTTNPVLYDQVSNRVIFSRAGRQTGDQTFTSIDLADYVYVEYLVPETARHTLVRNVYTTQGLTALATQNINDAQGDSNLEWLVEPGYFDGQTNLQAREVVAELNDPTDRINFRVMHPRYENPADAAGTIDPELFDPRVFKVEVQVGVGPTDQQVDGQDFGPGDTYNGYEKLDGQVRVQSAETVR